MKTILACASGGSASNGAVELACRFADRLRVHIEGFHVLIDPIPANARLLESRDLFVDQALLTGEPYPVEKQASEAALGAENPAGAANAVFAGHP
jgi:hypothetical protein